MPPAVRTSDARKSQESSGRHDGPITQPYQLHAAQSGNQLRLTQAMVRNGYLEWWREAGGGSHRK